MKVEELRLGNAILLGGFPCRVNLTTFERLLFPEMEKYSIFKGKYSPMPLSEHKLLWLGFNVTINNKDSGYVQLGLNHLGNDYMFCIECNEKPKFYFNNVFYDIEFVHELQNFYFVMEKEELTLKAS